MGPAGVAAICGRFGAKGYRFRRVIAP